MEGMGLRGDDGDAEGSYTITVTTPLPFEFRGRSWLVGDRLLTGPCRWQRLFPWLWRSGSRDRGTTSPSSLAELVSKCSTVCLLAATTAADADAANARSLRSW